MVANNISSGLQKKNQLARWAAGGILAGALAAFYRTGYQASPVDW